MKLKYCPKCLEELPMSSFTSARAKYCRKCLVIRKLEQRNAMTQRSLERTKVKKQKTVTVASIPELKKTAQKYFNKYIRLRDRDLPCISCQGNCGKVDAGHYIAQGSSGALRYNEDNVHAQGVGCNRWKHANLVEYRVNLVKKIGEDRVKWLEAHRHDVKKWSREELEEIINKYKQLTKESL